MIRRVILAACLAAILMSTACAAEPEPGFVSLFDGKTLKGWQLSGKHGEGYVARDGVLLCPAGSGGNLFTIRQYSDFVLRFDVLLTKGANNGVGIRTPIEGTSSYTAMEIQLLDDGDAQYANLHPAQYCGSVYKTVAAKRGSLKKPGEWNAMEISAIGRHMKVTMNGKVIVNADLNKVMSPEVFAEHRGFLRDRGYIGFLGHPPAEVAFRNIRIKDLSRPEKENTPPPGFKALFNGKDLKGWKGLVSSPPERAKMSADALAAEQKKADEQMRAHWKVVDGALEYDGGGNSLCTARDYADFEMLVDWKIDAGGDSGIYLRGSPQVQIWDDRVGSGGLYNNQKNPSKPIENADNKPGQWNRFRILMLGEKVSVWLNGKLVVDHVTMENYRERDKPIYPSEQIELQHHNSKLWFKNIYIREIAGK